MAALVEGRAPMRDPQDELFAVEERNAATIQLERNGKTSIMRIANPGELM